MDKNPEEEKRIKDSIKRQEKSFNEMKDFIDSQLAPNGHLENDFAPDIFLYMLDKVKENAEYHKIAAEAQEKDELDDEIEQWDNIIKAISNATEVRKSLENEKEQRDENRG